MSFTPVFPQAKEAYSSSSIDKLRNVVVHFPYYEGRPKRIRDMDDKHIKRFITKIKEGQMQETADYSLPFLQVCLMAELDFRNRKENAIANKILFVFKDPYIRHIVRTNTITQK